jgi:hypothetical protein
MKLPQHAAKQVLMLSIRGMLPMPGIGGTNSADMIHIAKLILRGRRKLSNKMADAG